jgi:hypothetical protein
MIRAKEFRGNRQSFDSIGCSFGPLLQNRKDVRIEGPEICCDSPD